MQHDQERRKVVMKNTALAVMVLAVLAGFCAGCGKQEKPEPKTAAPEKAEKWEPESVALPEGHSVDDGHDHSGHDHGAHEDHSGHNH
jgi:hypothetical protein